MQSNEGAAKDRRTPEEQARMSAYMSHNGTDAATSNLLADVVTDVWGAHYGAGSYVPFSVRFGIAHEAQRRLRALGES